MSATETERAWAAGFFDGEGWASAARYSRRTGGMTSTPTIGVGQNGPELLERFLAIVGVGSIKGPYGKSGMYAFTAHGLDKVEAVTTVIGPFLGSKKSAQIARVIADAREYRSTHPSRHFSDDAVRAIRLRLAQGEKQAAIALSLGVPKTTINAIARGRNYRGVGLLEEAN